MIQLLLGYLHSKFNFRIFLQGLLPCLIVVLSILGIKKFFEVEWSYLQTSVIFFSFLTPLLVRGIYRIMKGNRRIRATKSSILGLILWLCIVTIAVLAFSDLKLIENISENLKDLFTNICVSLFVGTLLYILLDAVFNSADNLYGHKENKFSYSLLAKYIKESKTNYTDDFKILSTFLRVFSSVKNIKKLDSVTLLNEKEDNHYFQTKLNNEKSKRKNDLDSLIKAMGQVAERDKVLFKILILDPDSDAATLRQREILASMKKSKELSRGDIDKSDYWWEEVYALEQIQSTLKYLMNIEHAYYNKFRPNNILAGVPDKRLNNKFNVRLYNSIPPYSYFKVDDYTSFSFYPSNNTVVDAQRWQFVAGMPFERFVEDKFNTMWNDSYDLVHYKYLMFSEHTKINVEYVDIYTDGKRPLFTNKIIIGINDDTDLENKVDVLIMFLLSSQSNIHRIIYRGIEREVEVLSINVLDEKISVPSNCQISVNKNLKPKEKFLDKYIIERYPKDSPFDMLKERNDEYGNGFIAWSEKKMYAELLLK